jgi:hypothetical protein
MWALAPEGRPSPFTPEITNISAASSAPGVCSPGFPLGRRRFSRSLLEKHPETIDDSPLDPGRTSGQECANREKIASLITDLLPEDYRMGLFIPRGFSPGFSGEDAEDFGV